MTVTTVVPVVSDVEETSGPPIEKSYQNTKNVVVLTLVCRGSLNIGREHLETLLTKPPGVFQGSDPLWYT